MNIKKSKEQIKNAMTAYFAKAEANQAIKEFLMQLQTVRGNMINTDSLPSDALKAHIA